MGEICLRWAIRVALALVALVGLALPASAAGGPVRPASATVAARDRYFDIRLQRATCGYEVLPHATWMRPEGQYCIVRLGFRNVSGAPVRLTLTAWFQYAYAAGGTRHPGRTVATAAESQRRNPFLEKVAPGAAVSGVLVFDIPTGERLTSLRIKESITSTGVTLPV